MKKLVLTFAAVALGGLVAFAQPSKSSVTSTASDNFTESLPTTTGSGNAALVVQKGRDAGVATGNFADVDQDGAKNQALVEQIHNNHRAILDQEGNNNDGSIKQRAAFNSNPPYPTKKNKWSNDHEMRQDGNNNDSRIVSFNDDNWGRVDVKGNNNFSHMGQSTNGVGHGNLATQYVTGNDNWVGLRQTRDNNESYNDVKGNGNVLSVRQIQIPNLPWNQTAKGNYSEVDIDGDNNDVNQANFNMQSSAGIYQLGDDNYAYVRVKGNGNDVKVDQFDSDDATEGGVSNDADVVINNGNNNFSRTFQDGDYNDSDIDVKNGNGNTSYADQLGMGNDSDIDQKNGNGNFGQVLQSGDYNDATVSQTGSNHFGAVFQYGNNNTGSVTQTP